MYDLMGLKEKIKANFEARRKNKKEVAGYRKLVAQKVKVAERQAYAKESEKQARLRAERRAKEKFNKPSFAQRIMGSVTPQAAPQAAPKPVVKRKSTKRRKPAKGRKSTRRRTRRTVRRAAPRTPTPQVSQPVQPSIRDLIS